MQNVGMINDVPVQISWHCLRRLVEMGVSAEELKALVLDPEKVYESKKYPGDVLHKRGEYSIAIKLVNGVYVIKTALYGSMAGWLKANEEGRLSPDRVRRLADGTGLPAF